MEKKNSKKKILIIVVAVLLLCTIVVMGVVIYRLMTKKEEPVKAERAVSSGLVVDNQVNEKIANARFTTDMNMIWTFPSGSAVSTNAIIGNSSSNQFDCYFEIYLNDEEQTLLYSSPVLPVGKRLDTLELNDTLPDGEYEATCTFHLLDDEDPDTELTTVSFGVTLMFIK